MENEFSALDAHSPGNSGSRTGSICPELEAFPPASGRVWEERPFAGPVLNLQLTSGVPNVAGTMGVLSPDDQAFDFPFRSPEARGRAGPGKHGMRSKSWKPSENRLSGSLFLWVSF